MSNKNTAQQYGQGTDIGTLAQKFYNSHLQHKDRQTALQQREKEFQTKTFWKDRDYKLNEAKHNLNRQKYNLAVDKHKLDVKKANDKNEWNAAKFNQTEAHHQDKMNVAIANTKIKAANHDIFKQDVAGKNLARNTSNQIKTNMYNNYATDRVKGTKEKANTISYQQAPVPKDADKSSKLGDAQFSKPAKAPNMEKATVGVRKNETVYKYDPQSTAAPGKVSAKNIKGTHGNRKKGLPNGTKK